MTQAEARAYLEQAYHGTGIELVAVELKDMQGNGGRLVPGAIVVVKANLDEEGRFLANQIAGRLLSESNYTLGIVSTKYAVDD